MEHKAMEYVYLQEQHAEKMRQELVEDLCFSLCPSPPEASGNQGLGID